MNIHGGYYGQENVIDFSVNLNPLGLPEKVKKYVKDNIKCLKTYPSINGNKAIKSLSSYYKIPEEQIIIGNGAIELIYLYAKTFSPKKVLIIQPTFNEYERAFRLSGSSCFNYNLKEDNNFNLQINDILDKLKNVRPELVVLCNPNNPTGNYINIEIIEQILLFLKEIKSNLIIDESFIEFEDLPSAKELLSYGNLFILRSMTKYFSIAGIRLGYGLGSKNIIEKLQFYKEPWTINGIAENIVDILLNDKQYKIKTRKWYNEEKKYIINKLKDIDWIKVYESHTNYYLCKLKVLNSNELQNLLLKNGIYIRTCNDFIGLTNKFIRIAIKNRQENDKLLYILERIKK